MTPSTWLGTPQRLVHTWHPYDQFFARLLGSGLVLGLVAIPVLYFGSLSSVPGGPSIVLIETAGTAERFKELTEAFDGRWNDLLVPLLWDFVFIAVYTAALVALALIVGPWGYRISALTGRARMVAGLVAVAAGLDVIENLGLLPHAAGLVSRENPVGWVLAIVAAAAWAKFLLLGLAILYVLGAVAGFPARPGWLPGPGELEEPDGPSKPAPPPSDGLLNRALALSGGGVRSGTFALGVLQRLERGKRTDELGWDNVTRVTAVSGGAYTAGAWQISRPPAGSAVAEQLGGAQDLPPPPWSRLSEHAISPEELHLRVNLGYLLDPAPAAAQINGDPTQDAKPAGPGSETEGAPAPVGVSPTQRLPQPAPRGPAGAVTTLLTGMLVNLAVLLVALVIVAVPVGWLVGSELVAPLPAQPESSAAGGSYTIVVTPTDPPAQPDTGDVEVTATPGQAAPTTDPVAWDRLIAPVVVWLVVGGILLVLWVVGRRLASTHGALAGLGSWAERWCWVLGRVALALTAALAVLLLVLPWALHELVALQGFSETVSWIRVLAASAFVGTVAKALWSIVKAGALQPFVTRMGGVLLGVIALIVGGWFMRAAAEAGPGQLPGPAWLDGTWIGPAVAAALVVGYALANPEWWAPASFYRGRLRLAFALQRSKENGRPTVKAYSGGSEPLLADYRVDPPNAQPAVPASGAGTPPPDPSKLVICAAAQVSDRAEHTVYGIPAWSLTLTPEQVTLNRPLLGSPGALRYTCDTRSLERLWARPDNPRLTTMAAVAMSGAAVAPGLGRHSKGSTNAFLALLNVRLGVWLPNPRYAKEFGRVDPDLEHATETPPRFPHYPRVRIGYLLKELFGVFDPDDPYLYVTDGGHWENSAVVEQLRGQDVLELVGVDGSGAAAGTMGTFADAMMLLYEEVGAQIDLDFRPFRIDPTTGLSRCAGLGVIRYRATSGVAQLGLIWYLRPAITATVPALAAAYAEQNPGFPNEPTSDQFFSDLQFEAYRLMGDHAAATLQDGREALLATLEARTTVDGLHEAAQGEGADLWAVRDLAACLGKDDDEAYQRLCDQLRTASDGKARPVTPDAGKRG